MWDSARSMFVGAVEPRFERRVRLFLASQLAGLRLDRPRLRFVPSPKLRGECKGARKFPLPKAPAFHLGRATRRAKPLIKRRDRQTTRLPTIFGESTAL